MTESPSKRQFTEILTRPDPAVDLAEASLLIACAEYPDLDVAHYLGLLDAMGADVGARLQSEPTATEAAAALNGYLFEELGFHGNSDDYYDPRNSFLNDVLDRRSGIPVTLSTVYMEVGTRAGLTVEGVGLPGHFIARVRGADGAVLVDPFHGGVRLTTEDCQERLDRIFQGRLKMDERMLAPCDRRTILARVLQNLKGIYTKAGDHLRALGIVDLLFRVRPPGPEDIKDRGLVYAALDCFAKAAEDLEQFLAMAPEAQDAATIRRRAVELRRKAALVN